MSLLSTKTSSSRPAPPKKRQRASRGAASSDRAQHPPPNQTEPALPQASTDVLTFPAPTTQHPSSTHQQPLGAVPSPYYTHLYQSAPFFMPVSRTSSLQMPAYPVTATSPIPPQPMASALDTPNHILKTATEREQARKMSHSAIERRRRERINDKILQLRQLIPSCADQDHLHKMTILQSAIDYITYLKDAVAKLDGDIHVNLKINRKPKPMVPKEVERFTRRFSVNEQSKHEKSVTDNNASMSPVSMDHLTEATGVCCNGPSTMNQHHPYPIHSTANRPKKRSADDALDSLTSETPVQTTSNADPRIGLKPMDVIKLKQLQLPQNPAKHDNKPLAEMSTALASLPSPMQQSFASRSSSPVSECSWAEEPAHQEEQCTASSSSLPTPLLTPRTPNHMSLENILC